MEQPRTEEPLFEQIKRLAGGAKNHAIYQIVQAGIACILGILALKGAKYIGAPAYIFAAVAFSAPAFFIASLLGRIKIKW